MLFQNKTRFRLKAIYTNNKPKHKLTRFEIKIKAHRINQRYKWNSYSVYCLFLFIPLIGRYKDKNIIDYIQGVPNYGEKL